MTVLEIIKRSTEFLAARHVESPRLQIELLLAHLLKMPRLKLYLDFEREVGPAEMELLRGLVKRRAKREPLQHIIGTTSFCGLEMEVNPSVLIPRPETEMLAERSWEYLKRLRESRGGRVTALDFGTGSGCLAIAVAKHAPGAEVYAVDISEKAIETARVNAHKNPTEPPIHFLWGEGFRAVPEELRFDLIVSNPPYIPTAEIGLLEPEVRDYDPRLALDGGEDGLEFYRLFSREAKGYLQAGGKLMVEFGDGQSPGIQTLFEKDHWKVEVVIPDHSGRLRLMTLSVL